MANSYRRFFHKNVATGSTTTVMTVPAATTAIVKSAIVENKNSSNNEFKMVAGLDGNASDITLSTTTVSTLTAVDLLVGGASAFGGSGAKGPVILEANDTLKFQASQASGNVIISVLLVDRN